MTIRCILIFFAVCLPEALLAQQSASTDSLVAINLEMLNTSSNETCPFLPYGESVIYFTRHNKLDETDRIWSAIHKPDMTWRDVNRLTGFDSLGTIGSLVNDSSKEIYFAGNFNTTKSNDLDIFSLVDGKPINLGPPVNTEHWESQPSISSDGRSLYFTSNREGEIDIYVSHRSRDGKWSEPTNLGSKINSGQYTGCPFISPDGRTLLFASGGSSIGLYMCEKTGATDTDWSEPVLLPYPINDHYTSLTPCLSHDNREFYFASNRPGGKGGFDIYMVRLPHGLASLYPQPTK
jgi:hypothetical protein